MTTPFAILTMSRSGYSTSLTDQSKTLPPGTYILLAVPAAEQARADALAHDHWQKKMQASIDIKKHLESGT